MRRLKATSEQARALEAGLTQQHTAHISEALVGLLTTA